MSDEKKVKDFKEAAFKEKRNDVVNDNNGKLKLKNAKQWVKLKAENCVTYQLNLCQKFLPLFWDVDFQGSEGVIGVHCDVNVTVDQP